MTNDAGNFQAPTYLAQVEQWGLQEITLHSTRHYDNPFTEVQLRGHFRSGEQEVVAEGFYDGNQTWKVRLMPQIQGCWRFDTSSNDPELTMQSGSFDVGAPGPDNHGPVTVQGQYHFAYADGTPYFPLGTTIYNWLNRDEKLELRTLATLTNSPFNKVRFLIFPKYYLYNTVEPPLYPYPLIGERKLSPDRFSGELFANSVQSVEEAFDLSRFNPAFFAHIEARLRELRTLNIEVELILFHPYDSWGFSNMGAAHDEAYLQYVVARFAAFRNVWWTLANEYDLFGRFLGDRMKEEKNWDHLLQLVQELDPYQHLRGIHNCFDWYDHSKPWVTHVVIQHQGKELYQVTLDAKKKYSKPVIVEEYGYEGSIPFEWGNRSAGEVVNLHWEVTMAGGYGSHGETYVRPGNILWWSVGGELLGDSPARLGFLQKIMAEAPYHELEPAPEVVKLGMALAKHGSYYLFRFPMIDYFKRPEINIEGEGLFQVELIDTWLMKTYLLGYTHPGKQSFFPHIGQGLLRITRADQPLPNVPTGTITELISAFGTLLSLSQESTRWSTSVLDATR